MAKNVLSKPRQFAGRFRFRPGGGGRTRGIVLQFEGTVSSYFFFWVAVRVALETRCEKFDMSWRSWRRCSRVEGKTKM